MGIFTGEHSSRGDSRLRTTTVCEVTGWNGHQMIKILVYAKCSPSKRLHLWSEIYHVSLNMVFPWLVGGDFNVILDAE